MVSRQSRVGGQRGLTLVELMVAIAVIGIISMMATPLFMTFLRAMETRGAAGELVTLLNQARQMAIATNSSYRVEIEPDNNRLRFVRTSGDAAPGCNPGNPGNPVCIGPGTDDQGYRRLENQARLVNVTANPTFNHLGTGNNGTITVQDSRSSSSLRVRISTGRIRICDASNCPN